LRRIDRGRSLGWRIYSPENGERTVTNRFYQACDIKSKAIEPLMIATNLDSLAICVLVPLAGLSVLTTVVITRTVGEEFPPSAVIVATFPAGESWVQYPLYNETALATSGGLLLQPEFTQLVRKYKAEDARSLRQTQASRNTPVHGHPIYPGSLSRPSEP
jgi:hypothetical protein